MQNNDSHAEHRPLLHLKFNKKLLTMKTKTLHYHANNDNEAIFFTEYYNSEPKNCSTTFYLKSRS